ncbi:MAG TPA: phytanoyl-CoA dioxygenase family protein [Pyrinomonadaceae bacterium]|jgi:ectoine hydroxylase-related dioxygenase (phytanoyl-CoA dioxygenase family)
MNDMRTHAVREFHENRDEADALAEEIRNIGYTVVDGGLSAAELQRMREKIDAVYERQVRELGGEAQLHRINDGNIARCLAGYDDYFVHVAAHPRVMAVARKLLGPNFVLMSQNGIINRPTGAHYQQTWHRDLNYQHFVSSRPLALSAMVCVDEFNAETGGTCLLPASHKSEVFPSFEYVRRHEVQVSAPAGAILVFDAMVYHRSGHNRSGRPRRGVNHIYTLPLIKQQISLPRMLGGKFSDDPFLRTFLGYDSETGESVQHWRARKLEQATAETDVPVAAK